LFQLRQHKATRRKYLIDASSQRSQRITQATQVPELSDPRDSLEASCRFVNAPEPWSLRRAVLAVPAAPAALDRGACGPSAAAVVALDRGAREAMAIPGTLPGTLRTVLAVTAAVAALDRGRWCWTSLRSCRRSCCAPRRQW